MKTAPPRRGCFALAALASLLCRLLLGSLLRFLFLCHSSEYFFLRLNFDPQAHLMRQCVFSFSITRVREKIIFLLRNVDNFSRWEKYFYENILNVFVAKTHINGLQILTVRMI